jgi:hypothetical protein
MRSVFNQQPGRGYACEEGGDRLLDRSGLARVGEGRPREESFLHGLPEALQRCLREHVQDLQKRNIRSSAILAVFNQFCYVPKHTVGEQLLQVREAKREQAAYDSATSSDR